LAHEFKKMNVWMVHIGVESGNQRTIDGLQKHIRLDQVIEACRIFQAHGIKVFGFFMLYHAWEENGELAFETRPMWTTRCASAAGFLASA
jgi:radical SAM superfamily enzyme YgiQ (UPF0313 family)